MKTAWPIIEPKTKFHNNWHIECIAEHLQALTFRQIQKLIICVPPGFMKSILVSVMWPAWHWLHCPEDRILSGSFDQALANRDAGKAKDIIKSGWYQGNWGHIVKIRKGFDDKEFYANTKTGWRKPIYVGGGTGQRAEVRSLDDPHNIHDVMSNTVRQGDIEWLKDTWFQRGSDPRVNLEVYVQQRLHERDVVGFLQAEVGGYVEVILPMEYEPHRAFVSVLAKPKWKQDPRKEAGDLLDPVRIPRIEVDKIKSVLGPYKASGQLQQRPAPEEGGIFKKHWWRVWHYPNQPLSDYELVDANGTTHILKCEPLPHAFDREVQSWDCTFEEGVNNDYVAGQHLNKKKANCYTTDYFLAKLDFVPTTVAVEAMSAKFQNPGKVLIEKAANGPAVISALHHKVPGIKGVLPRGSKVARASAYSMFVESGNCYLPHPSIATWTLKFIENMAIFPNGEHDDDVDAWSQGMDELYGVTKMLVPCLPEFDEHLHLSRAPIFPVQGLRAFRFWYPGVYPTCIIGQVLRKGGIAIYHTIQGENMGFEEFIRMRVMPVVNEWYRWPLDWIDIGPPLMTMSPFKDAISLERTADIIDRVLKVAFVPGNKDFQSRLQATKEIFDRRNGILINCDRTQGESAHHIIEALREGYGYELDPVTQYVKKDQPFNKNPSFSVGEALTTGISYFFADPVKPYQKPVNIKQIKNRAKGYAVQ